jgi:TPR repeat protein
MWEAVADLGDPEVQYSLGLVYEQDKTNLGLLMAHSWYIKVAEHFHKDALYRLGQFYAEGWGVEKDYTLSIDYYQKSAIVGNIDALYQLGVMYENGQGVVPDKETAISYYNRASELGNSESQFRLGTLYEEGLLLQQDILESLRYYTKAASQGHEEAYGHLLLLDDSGSTDSYFLETRFLFFYKLSDERADDTRETAFLGLIKYDLGRMYLYGLGTRTNCQKAWKCFKSAYSIYGERKALEFLKVKYQNTDTMSQDSYLKKLEMWEVIAGQIAKEKKTSAKEEVGFSEEELLTGEEKYELGLIYYYGVYAKSQGGEVDTDDTVVKPNYSEALKYFKVATSNQAVIDLNSYRGSNADRRAIAKYKADQYYMNSSYHLGMIECAEIIHTGSDSQASYYLDHSVKGNYPKALELMDMIKRRQDDQTILQKAVFNILFRMIAQVIRITNFILAGCI